MKVLKKIAAAGESTGAGRRRAERDRRDQQGDRHEILTAKLREFRSRGMRTADPPVAYVGRDETVDDARGR